MAEKRMFTKTIIDSDAFLDMPQTTQLLYFHLSMRADDDGFINNPKSITRNVKCGEDDLKILVGKKFIIPFESGVVVIKHWKLHNYIAKDRYTETKYKDEKAMLDLDENKAYTAKDVSYTECIQPVHELDTQVRLDKIRIDKSSKYNVCFETLWKMYPRKKEKTKAYKCYQSRIKDGFREDEITEAVKNYVTECKARKTEENYIKLCATFLGCNTPFVDYLDKNYTPVTLNQKTKQTATDFYNDMKEWVEERDGTGICND